MNLDQTPSTTISTEHSYPIRPIDVAELTLRLEHILENNSLWFQIHFVAATSEKNTLVVRLKYGRKNTNAASNGNQVYLNFIKLFYLRRPLQTFSMYFRLNKENTLSEFVLRSSSNTDLKLWFAWGENDHEKFQILLARYFLFMTQLSNRLFWQQQNYGFKVVAHKKVNQCSSHEVR